MASEFVRAADRGTSDAFVTCLAPVNRWAPPHRAAGRHCIQPRRASTLWSRACCWTLAPMEIRPTSMASPRWTSLRLPVTSRW